MSKLKVASILFLLSTFILKFSSMIRDLIIAGLFGDSYQADAYIAAMTIPNALVLFLLTGMKDAFLPSYYKFHALGRGDEHLTNIVKGTMWMSLAYSIIGIVLAAPIVRIFYPSFAQYEDGFFIATWTVVIYFASLVFVGVNAVYEGFFDANRKFSFSVFSQTSVVLMTIVFALAFHEVWGILAVPIGYLVGTILSLLIKLIYRTPKKFLNWKQPLNKAEVREFYNIFWPVGLTIAVGQINLMVNTFYAAGLGEGTVANLNYAFRLVNIPQAIFGVTIATIAFPIIAQARVMHNMDHFRKGIEKGILYMLVFITPTLAGMWLLMEPLVSTVYERGAFDAEATTLTASYAILYIGSTFFYSIQAVIAKGFYTLEKGHYMMRIGLLSIGLNIISNYVFAHLFGAPGIALSASLVGMFYSTITFTMLWKLIDGMETKYLLKNGLQIVIATAAMISILIVIEWQTAVSSLPSLIHIIVLGGLGAVIYFAVLLLFKNEFAKKLIERGGKPSSLI
ncbi:murein biosynthesis integral membrane protein MurJ [Planococcus glaciei]|uniref:murein biosynthesis integral membrane protein MurJ n=1 Tax=Planococcus glaciei TaxID=459472 RepID=UPI001C72B7E3|nr:lipid II flippase MurJ [Planococcus glaciei]MBX0316836.1 polysaccharide biosynthesis C-terminal domain-containing protein [Planococcus glaciei]